MKKKLRFSYLAFLEQLILVSILLTEVHSWAIPRRVWATFTRSWAITSRVWATFPCSWAIPRRVWATFTRSWAIPSQVWATLHVHGRFPHFYGRLSNIPPDTMNLLKNVKPLNLHQSNNPDLSYAFLLSHHPNHLAL